MVCDNANLILQNVSFLKIKVFILYLTIECDKVFASTLLQFYGKNLLTLLKKPANTALLVISWICNFLITY